MKRSNAPICRTKSVISLVVKLGRKGEHVQVAMIGRDSIFGVFSALGDATALNSAVVLVPGVASTLDIDRLRAAADQSVTFRAMLVRHGLAVYAQSSRRRGATPRTAWNPGWRDVCCKSAICRATTNWS